MTALEVAAELLFKHGSLEEARIYAVEMQRRFTGNQPGIRRWRSIVAAIDQMIKERAR